MSAALDLLFIIVIAFLVFVFLSVMFGSLPNAFRSIGNLLGISGGMTAAITNNTGNGTALVITPVTINQSALAGYVLNLINNDRAKYGLAPVTLSNESSAQQHSNSMLGQNYFSHWDLLGMKPYMRYTLLGGKGSVTENVAYETDEQCGAFGCTGTIDPKAALQAMEYSMMYNDSACCNNGHRDNILNPNHNEVSIGVAYNGSAIYLTQDFIDNYVQWSGNAPLYGSNGEVYLQGNLSSGYTVSQVYVSYDPPVSNYTRQTVPSGPYAYGKDIAGIVSSRFYYYKNVSTIVADTYYTQGSGFSIDFNINNLISQYGAGEYTAMLILNNSKTGKSFTGSTYTIFINRQGKQYVPAYV